MSRVLIIEDNPANMKLASFLLQSAGHTVLCATDAEAGLALARSSPLDLILMDIQLPGMDGLAAIGLLKSDEVTRAIPVIALTALAMKGDEERIRAAGCNGYIAKPMRYKEFLATIAAELGPLIVIDTVDTPQRVLIVDDERQNRQLLEIMLKPEGFIVETASSGEDALHKVTLQAPDLILLDVMMPGMDGYTLANKLKSIRATRGIPIIIITALDDRQSRMLGLSAGAEDFLTKPVDRAELCMRVRNLLRLKAHGDYHDKYSKILEGEVGSRTADLIESESRFRQLAASMREVFFLFDPLMTKVFYVSPAYESIYGRSSQSLYGDPSSWAAAIHPDDRAHVRAQTMPEGSLVPFDVEYRIVRPNGGVRSIRARGSPIRDVGGEIYRFGGIAEDTTERRQLEAQVRQSSKMDAIGRLASGVAHDFNNLLSVILSYSHLLITEFMDGDPIRSDLEEIRAAGLRAVDLTRQLLAFSRQQLLQPKVVDLGEIVAAMENMLRRLIGEDVELTVRAEAALGRILVDPGQMEQVIMNLAVNARDAMPNGGKITIETTVAMFDEHDVATRIGVKAGPHVVLTVTDSGIGMNKATQSHIFEPFFTTKEAGKGTGLGLATVFGIVRQSEGAIWVDSEPGKGTTFHVSFPTVEDAMTVEPMAPPDGPLRGRETILLVEDEHRVRSVAVTILRKYGYDVLEAQSSGDALLLCEQHTGPIHLLLTDVVMPRMGGRQLAERLGLLRPEMKVLYMSGYADDATRRAGIQEAAVAFIQKPITPEAMARKVREVLGDEPGSTPR